MTEEKTKLREHIQKVKYAKENNLTFKEVKDMFYFDRNYDGLMQLMFDCDKPIREIKESIGTSQQNWNMTIKGAYHKLSLNQKALLANALGLPYKQVNEVIKRDIENQQK